MSLPQRKICRPNKALKRVLRPRKGFLVFLVFLVLSGLFWLSTALNGFYDYEIDMPVSVEGLPKNVILTTDSVDFVRVSVHDKGYALLQYVKKKNVPAVIIDFPSFDKQGKCVISSTELHKIVTKKLPNSISVSSIKPDKLEFGYVTGQGKNVPVRLSGDFTPASNYYLEHTEIEPSHVTVYAPADEIDSIHYALTERMQVRNFSDTVRTRVRLENSPRTKTVPAEVDVTLYPDVLTEEEAEVPVTTVNVPEGTVLRIFPSRVKVRYTVGVSAYRNVNVSQFVVEADYEKTAGGAEKCPLRLSAVPKGVKRAVLETSGVDYLVEN